MSDTTEVKIGDRVRSYDFETSRDYYVTGTVVGFSHAQGCPRYEIAVESRTWEGKTEPGSGHVYPPVNGTPSLFFGPTNFVERTEDAEADHDAELARMDDLYESGIRSY
jgi:hypothetical protein